MNESSCIDRHHLELSCRPFVFHFHSAIVWSILILLDRSFRKVENIYSGVRRHLPCLDTTTKMQWTTGGVGEGIDKKRGKMNFRKSERSRAGGPESFERGEDGFAGKKLAHLWFAPNWMAA